MDADREPASERLTEEADGDRGVEFRNAPDAAPDGMTDAAFDDAADDAVEDARWAVVGIGASAGGLEALQTLAERISPDTDATYVVIQHLSPDHDSIIDQLLAARTALPVRRIEDDARLEHRTVYVNPPGFEVTIDGDRFRLHERPEATARQAPIDRFLRSLANSHGRKASCVILSGTGTDGTEGLKAVKAAGGFAIVQEAANARFPGMPNSAAATGVVDFVLRAPDIPARLDEIIRHRSQLDQQEEREALHRRIEARLGEFTALLGERHAHDFSEYKPGTLVRRIERRMSLLRLRTVDSFLRRLEADEAEGERLLQDFLIGVTRFFRDADAFEALRAEVIVPLVERRPEAIRAWVPACSTGEEAYTVAMLFLEAMRGLDERIPLQVFGTDIDIAALTHAREGVFAAGAVMNLPDDMLQRYFRAEGNGWRAASALREVCVFAPHNLIQDPPYSRLDVVTCRNLLIYLSGDLQRRVIPRFHFALKPSGALLLGPAEGLAGEDALFVPLDKGRRLYRRNDQARVHYTPLSDRSPRERPRTAMRATEGLRSAASGRTDASERVVERVAERAYLAHHAKPFALVTPRGDVAYLSEAMTAFARPARGEPSTRIEAFLARELRAPVRSAMERALASKASAFAHDIAVREGGGRGGDGRDGGGAGRGSNGAAPGRVFDVSVSPVPDGSDLLLVVLDTVRVRSDAPPGEGAEAGDRAVREELAALQERYGRLRDEFDRSMEDAAHSNAELLAMNEELQSSNEELETSREELQSINEELETVNAELGENNRQLLRANSDLQNLFESTDLATLFLDPQLGVRSFTPATTRLFGIKERDVGRPIRDLSSRIDYPELEADAEAVQRTLQTVEREVTVARTDETFILRIRPYRTTDNRLDGFVLAFYDITARKRNEVQLARNERDLARQYGELETLYDTTPVGLSLMDHDLRWLRINRQLADINGFPVEEHIGKRQDELIPDIDGKIAQVQREVLRYGKPIGGFHVEGYTPREPDRLRHWIVDYYPVFSDGEVFACGTCVREVTGEYALSRELSASEARLRQTVQQSPIHFVQTDEDGTIAWAQGGLAGLPTSQSKGLPISADFPDEVAETILERTDGLRREQVPQTFDVSFELGEGTRVYQVILDRFEADPNDRALVFVFSDVTDRRALQDRQSVLLGELQHRVKNTLATIAAISRFLLRGSDTAESYQKRLDERLRSISRSHDLLTSSDWRGASLADIVAMEAAPYADDGGRVRTDAAPVRLDAHEAVSMGMAIHELMTNAAKHGALSVPEGWVEIAARERADGGRRLEWKEHDGPPLDAPPNASGFGSFLLQHVLAADLDGEVSLDFERDGLRCTVDLPPPADETRNETTR